MSRALVPVLRNENFFDDIFNDVDREIAKQHQDLRNAMMRLAPRDPIAANPKRMAEYLKKLRCPIVKKADGSEALELQLDLSNYKPEEVKIKTTGKLLEVDAKHEEVTDDHSVYQEFHRKFTLPDGVDPEKVESSLSKDGILSITGPVDNSKKSIENKK